MSDSLGLVFVFLVAAGVALFAPAAVQSAVPTAAVPYLLGIAMFGMGLSLRARDFRPVLTRPCDVLLGTAAQFVLMPLLAVVLSRLLGLPEEMALGMALVGCCPGGTASNVMAFLAGGDVALSVALTCVSTVLAPLMTPALMMLCVGRTVPVDALGMCLSVVKVVAVPVAAGLAVHEFWPRLVDRVRGALPFVSAAAVVAITASVTAAGAVRIRESWGIVVLAVVLHNGLGLLAGWGVARAFGLDAARRRTVSIEVGMQNSGLAVSLAAVHFAAYPLAAVPGALFSVWHNLSGLLLAAAFRRCKA